MKVYVVSLGAGLLVGLIYSILNVRSPAPPTVALVRLFGILMGEQLFLFGKQLFAGSSIVAAWHEGGCSAHLFGMLPGSRGDADKAKRK